MYIQIKHDDENKQLVKSEIKHASVGNTFMYNSSNHKWYDELLRQSEY